MAESDRDRSGQGEDVLAETRMSFGEHLDELRSRLIKAIYGLAVGFAVCLYFGGDIIAFLAQPLVAALRASGLEESIYQSRLPEAFVTYVKVALVSGIFVSSPWIFYHLWKFVGSGLYSHERRYVHVVAPFSTVLFIFGGVFFIWVVAPISCNFFIRFGTNIPLPEVSDNFFYRMLYEATAKEREESQGGGAEGEVQDGVGSVAIEIPVWMDKEAVQLEGVGGGVEAMWEGPRLQLPADEPGAEVRITFPLSEREQGVFTVVTQPATRSDADSAAKGEKPLVKSWFTLSQYISLIMLLMLAFGIAFQMPLVVIFLGRTSLVTLSALRAGRKYVLFGIVICSALLTPPDVVSQVALTVPMYLLYEAGILVLWVWPNRS